MPVAPPKMVIFQISLKNDLDKLWHYFFSSESWDVALFKFDDRETAGGLAESEFHFEYKHVNENFQNF